MDTDKLQAVLAEKVDGEVRFDAGSRGAYAHDGSNYRQPPLGVVVPRTPEAAVAAVGVCAEFGAPVVSRGGGTSLAGQCCNTAVVIDWTKYCHQVVSSRSGRPHGGRVQPGIALDKLNDAAEVRADGSGPKPSTHVRCTIGGMIGNNSCGSTAAGLRQDGRLGPAPGDPHLRRPAHVDGPTSDADCEQIVAAGGRKADIYRRLRAIRDNYLAPDQDPLPGHPAPGVRLQPGRPAAGEGFNVARALVGTESTW